MSSEKITAEVREEFGKGAARRIRRENKIPAVLYGHGEAPVHVTLPGHETMMALRHGGTNSVLELQISGGSQLALAREVQVDPIRRVIEHIDFVAVRSGEKVTVDVPIQVVGTPAPDSLVVTENNTIQVESEATHIPELIEVDITGLAIGKMVHAADLVLPKGTTLLADPELLIVNVTGQISAEALEAELEEAEAEAGIERDESDEAAAESAESTESGASDSE
ncbi:50S ribosomal protein L25/general stress protein Ctc [Nocardioides campestrisoli]|uniref:50S ribosomal protein L25/general stress protein Ctc n=1 Tax=Nocardioides campestrisoli TaxID=2736757 RepID=UPI00163D4327|nr:50S ribosomal protein L25/general stress protein Ctc [Nocardioides campestrisoli]